MKINAHNIIKISIPLIKGDIPSPIMKLLEKYVNKTPMGYK